jgi:hypothetical protein
MVNNLADIDPELRARLAALVHRNPGAQERVDELLATRAAGDANKRIEIDNILERMVAPATRASIVPIIAVAALIAVTITFAILSKQRAAAIERGTPTIAKILRTTPGDCSSTPKRSVCLRLELELHPTGAPVYIGSLSEPISVAWTSRVQPGLWLTVSVDPDAPDTILFDERTMAVPAPAPPPGA